VQTRSAEVRDLSRRGWDVIRREKVKGFYEMMMGATVRSGAANLVLTSGLGGMRPNTVILGFYHAHQQLSQDPLNPGYVMSVNEYVSIILDAISFEKNVLIARNFDSYDKTVIEQQSKSRKLRTKMTIDVWHVGACTGGGPDAAYKLCIQLGYVLWRADFFHKYCQLRFFALTPTEEEGPGYEAQLRAILLDFRIPDPNITVVPLDSPQDDIMLLPVNKRHALINATIYSYSTQTAVTFIPISHPPEISTYQAEYVEDLDALTVNLPPTMLVYGQKVVITNEL
jgi:potassium/chloride transporter 9